MICDLWNNVKTFCGCPHEQDQPLELKQETSGLVYFCPICEETEHKNRISVYEYEKMIDKISKELSSSQAVSLVNMKWNRKNIYYEIVGHKTKIHVKVINYDTIKTQRK